MLKKIEDLLGVGWVRYAIALALLLGCVYAVYRYGYTRAETIGQLALKQEQERNVAAENKLRQDASIVEQDLRQQVSILSRKGYNDLQNAKATADSTIANLTAGNLKLRKRLAAYSANETRGPNIGTASRVGDPTSEQAIGLQPADAQFLVRFGSDAEQRSEALKTCVAIAEKNKQALDNWYRGKAQSE